MHTECVAENANIIFIWAPDPQPRERELEREHILHNIQDSGIPWLPSHPDWNSPPSSLCIRLFEFFKPPKNKATQEQAVRPQMEQIALLWKQTQAEYLNEKWSFCLSWVAGRRFMCVCQWGEGRQTLCCQKFHIGMDSLAGRDFNGQLERTDPYARTARSCYHILTVYYDPEYIQAYSRSCKSIQ